MTKGLTSCGVGKLTARTNWRRVSDALCVIGSTLVFASSAAAQDDWQDIDEIRTTAVTYVTDRVGHRPGTDVRAGHLDPRLKLGACDQPLEGFMQRGREIGSRTIVGVRCEGSRPWKVYVPIEVFVTRQVLVAANPLSKGHLVTAADLRREPRDVTRMTSGYIDEPAQVIGQRIRMPVMVGRPLTPRMLEADSIIRRGQTVTLVVASGSLDIKMGGKALSDGALGQRIQVENTNSGRIVEGIVRSAEHVEVLVPRSTRNFHAKPKVSAVGADTQVSNNDR